MDENKDFGQRLKSIREKKNLSRKDVAEKLGLTVAGYGNYENGKREPKIEILKKIAEVFGVSIDYLIGKNLNPENDSMLFLENAGFYCEESPDGKNIRILMCENHFETFSREELDAIVRTASRTVSSLTGNIVIHEVLSCIDRTIEMRKEKESDEDSVDL